MSGRVGHWAKDTLNGSHLKAGRLRMTTFSDHTCRQTVGAFTALLLATLCLLIWAVKGSLLLPLLCRRLLLEIV